jgi:hypothetical protein
MKSDIEMYKDKIKFVEADLASCQNENGSERKRIALIDYIAYLKDELKMLEDEERTRTSNSK